MIWALPAPDGPCRKTIEALATVWVKVEPLQTLILRVANHISIQATDLVESMPVDGCG